MPEAAPPTGDAASAPAAAPPTGGDAAPPEADAATPRSRRDRPAKPALSRETIVDAALAIVREEGIDTLTMRRLAQELDTGPASLYVYFANRDELWDLLFDAAIGAIATEPTEPERWREQLHELAGRMVHVLAVEYPGMARLAMARIPTGDEALRVVESMLSLLKAGGVGDQAAAYAADMLNMYITAIAYEQSLYATLFQDPDHETQEVERVAGRFSAIPADRYPTVAALARHMTIGDGDERFSLGLDVIVNGLLGTPTEGRLTRASWLE